MSDTDPQDEPEQRAESSTIRTALDPGGAGRYVLLTALAVLALLAIIATFQLYNSVSALIETWVAAGYRPMFRAAFNLVVLLLAVAGIGVVLKRIAAYAD